MLRQLGLDGGQLPAGARGGQPGDPKAEPEPVGQLVAAGLLDADQVRAGLLAAALEAGNPEAKAQATITSGLRGGMARPRRRRRPGDAA